MPQLALQCPQCRAEKIGFAYRSHTQVKPNFPQTLLFMQCEGCGQGVIAVIPDWADLVAQWLAGATGSPGTILLTYPEPKALKAPADIPEPVRRAFLSGLDNLGRSGGANAAGAMFRRAIELAARSIDKTAPPGITLL